MSIKIGNNDISKIYLGSTEIEKIYQGDTAIYEGDEPTPSLPYQYAIVNDITNYTDTDYIDVYDRKTMKWYKLNNLSEYEEYGVFGDSRQNTYYTGKLVVEGNAEYEWNGTSWVYVGEAGITESFYAPTDDEIMDAGYGNDLCMSGFTKYRFTIMEPATSRLSFSDQPCDYGGGITVRGPWEVGVTYDAGQTLYIPQGGMYEIEGCGFEFGEATVSYAKEYATKERPMFAKAYDTLALAEADKGNVGLNTAAVLPNNDVYTFSADGSLVATPHYKMVGRLSGTTECLYEPSSDDKTVTNGWASYLDKTKLLNAIIDDATSIVGSAFGWCSSLTSVTIPNSITSIGDYAFRDDSSLASINIPSSVTSIGLESFCSCGLTSATIGDSVTSIGDRAFYNCQSLTSITIPNSVTSIGSSVFNNCTGLTSVTIGNSVTSIGSGAFGWCSSLVSITSLATTAPAIQSGTFRSVKSNGTLKVPQGSTGYNVWMGTGNYYLGKYKWAKVEQ